MRRPLLVLLVLVSPAWAQKDAPIVVVGAPATIGVDADAAATFGELLRAELIRQGYRVVPRGQTPPAACGDPACAAELMRQTGANVAVVVTLSRLGDKVIVTYDYVSADGRLLLADRGTAANVGDLEPLAIRIASSVATGRPLADTIGTTTVTATESKEQARRKTLFTKGLRLGVLVPLGSSYAGSGTMADLGISGMWELSAIAVDADMSFAWTLNPGDEQPAAFLFELNLGGKYFVDPEADTGLYIGAGLGFRSVHVDERRFVDEKTDTKVGLGAYAGVGVVFLRTADVHLVVDARYDVNFFTLHTSDGDVGAHGLALTVGVAFNKLWFL